jgi:zinc protease
LFIGNHILGGSGLVSLLAEEVREARGLSYSIYSYFAPMREAGPFAAVLQTSNAQASEAIEIVRTTIARFLAQGPTEEQLLAAKQNLSGGFALRIDSNKKLLGYLSVIGFYDLPLDYLHTWIEKIETTTAEDIRLALQLYLDLDKMHLITVGGEH